MLPMFLQLMMSHTVTRELPRFFECFYGFCRAPFGLYGSIRQQDNGIPTETIAKIAQSFVILPQ
jgi:hypothetical protein